VGEPATLRRWASQRAVWIAFVAVAVLVVAQLALVVSKSSADEAETILALIGAAILATRRPVVTLGVIVTLVAFGWNPSLVQAGGIDLRALDLPVALLVVQVLFDRSRPKGLPEGSKYIVGILAMLGLSTVYIAINGSGEFGDAFTAWARLVATFAVAWFASMAVKSKRDFTWILRVLIVAIMAAVFYAALKSVGAGADARAEAFGGPNVLGLFAGVLVVGGLHSSVLPNRESRFAAVIVGLAGLVMARSIASIASTAVAIIVGGLGVWSAHRFARRGRRDAGVRTVSRLVLALVVVFAILSSVRPVDLPGSEGFGQSSTAIRVSVGYAGIEVWQAHPLFGVGWQQSGTEGVINAPSVVEAVQERFGENFRTYLEVGGTGVTSVHNMYIQFLAETGIIGVAVLLWALIGLALVVRRWMRALDGDAWWTGNARFLGLAMLLLLVWWNDNPLFGGQPETFLAPLLIGFLAAAVRIGGPEAEAGRAELEAQAALVAEAEAEAAATPAARRANAWRGRVPDRRQRPG
jgi:O-antigen ligase